MIINLQQKQQIIYGAIFPTGKNFLKYALIFNTTFILINKTYWKKIIHFCYFLLPIWAQTDIV